MKVETMTVRPYAKAGVTFLSEDSIATTARFAGGPAGSSFFVVSKFDDVFANINAGVQLFSDAGVNLRFNYDGKFGENSRENAFDAKVTVNY